MVGIITMIRYKGIPQHLKNQVAHYTKNWSKRQILSASIIDTETIRIWYRDEEERLTSEMFPLLNENTLCSTSLKSLMVTIPPVIKKEDEICDGKVFVQC